MKKLLAIVLAMVMTISMGMMLLACDPTDEHTHNYEWVDNGDGTHKQHCSVEGCDKPDINIGNHDFTNGNCVCGAEKPAETTVTLASLISNVDLEKGLTIRVAADGEIDIMGALMGVPGEEKSPLSISDETKIGLSNGAFKMDNEINVSIGTDGEGFAIALSPRIYVRDTKAYIGLGTSADQSNDDIIFDLSEMTIDENSQITEILPMITENFGALLDEIMQAPLPFIKDGEVFKAEVDVLTPVSQVVGMFAEFIKDITVDTTVGDLYNMIGGKEMLDGLLGDMTGKDAYVAILSVIKELPEDMIPAEAIAMIPETVEEFIAFVEDGTGIELPEMGDKTLAQYADETINLFKDVTVFEIAYTLNSGESQPEDITPAAMPDLTPEELAAAKEAMQAEIDAFKAQLSHIAKKLTTNKLVLSFEADSKGALASVKADITLDYEVMNKLVTALMGSMFSETETDTNDMPAMTMSISVSVEYAATAFVDETKLVTDKDYLGSYKLVSLTETIGEEENATKNSYKLGDKYGDVTLGEDTVDFSVNEVPYEYDPTVTELAYDFTLKMFDPQAPVTDSGTLSIGEKGYEFWSGNYGTEYSLDSIYINADGTFTLKMHYNIEGVLHSVEFILTKAE